MADRQQTRARNVIHTKAILDYSQIHDIMLLHQRCNVRQQHGILVWHEVFFFLFFRWCVVDPWRYGFCDSF